jgi:hypothetical protein
MFVPSDIVDIMSLVIAFAISTEVAEHLGKL